MLSAKLAARPSEAAAAHYMRQEKKRNAWKSWQQGLVRDSCWPLHRLIRSSAIICRQKSDVDLTSFPPIPPSPVYTNPATLQAIAKMNAQPGAAQPGQAAPAGQEDYLDKGTYMRTYGAMVGSGRKRADTLLLATQPSTRSSRRSARRADTTSTRRSTARRTRSSRTSCAATWRS